MLTALVIFLIIVSAAYALFDTGRGLASRGELEARRHQAARAAMRAVEADLKGAFGFTAFDTGFRGVRGGSTDRPADTLEFVAFNHHPKTTGTQKEFDVSRVAYSIDDDPGTEASGLVRTRARVLPQASLVVDSREGLEEVAADVVGLRFRYYDGSAWQDGWDSTTSNALPEAVEVVLHVRAVWRDIEDVQTFMTRFWLPVAATTPDRQP